MGKIPPEAKQVFHGAYFDVYQWQQVLYDGQTTATFEILKRPDTVKVLAVDDGKLLLVRDSQPHRPTVYSFPGGGIDAGETPEAGGRRELEEETGYTAEHLALFLSTEPSHKIDWTVYYFIAQGVGLTHKPDPGIGEQIELVWVPWAEFLDITKRPDFIDKDLALHLYRMTPSELQQFRTQLGL